MERRRHILHANSVRDGADRRRTKLSATLAAVAEQAGAPEGATTYARSPGSTLEFDRVAAFSDGVFAIALTLLVVTVDLPDLPRSRAPNDLAAALWEQRFHVLSYLLSFALIGRYWVAHHSFFASLRAITPGFVGLNLVFLGAICFLPYPTDVLGNYPATTPAVVFFAACLTLASSMETVLYACAYRRGLLATTPSHGEFRRTVLASQTPSLVFVVSILVAFVNASAAMYVWLATLFIAPVFGRAAKRAGAAGSG